LSDADRTRPREMDAGGTAKLLVVLLAFCWGFNWISAAFALREVPPWSLRFVSTGIGALALLVAVPLSGRKLGVTLGQFRHIAIAGFFNVAFFNVCSAFAQLNGATSRAVIITYSMPIWSTALAWLVLGERLDKARVLALALCIGGLAILVWPLFAAGLPLGVFFALGSAFGWTIATVYIKWAQLDVDPLTNAAWQLTFGTALIMVGMLIFEGYPRIWPLHAISIIAILFIGLFGTGLAHFLWWTIVGKLPTITASIGALLVPVIGVTASTILLGERPTTTDIIGFVLIFAAAACVLLQPNVKHTEMPE
jgi:drug/metabolite transporter (DMT)-like permease